MPQGESVVCGGGGEEYYCIVFILSKVDKSSLSSPKFLWLNPEQLFITDNEMDE